MQDYLSAIGIRQRGFSKVDAQVSCGLRSLRALVAVALLVNAWIVIAEPQPASVAQLGPRPFFLVDKLRHGRLRSTLEACAATTEIYRASPFSMGHRGAPLQFPEHTRESYEAAARMGAGIVECDVTFTRDRQLVCRHSMCDLHSTTNILQTPLAATCRQAFKPAAIDPYSGELLEEATAECCTSDLTLAEFRQLRGRVDAIDRTATTVDAYLNAPVGFRTTLYGSGTLLSHADSIALLQRLGVGFAPELKAPQVSMPFDGFSQLDYADALVAEYRAAGIDPAAVWPQSFAIDDIRHWVQKYPRFGRQAVYLIGADGPLSGPAKSLTEDPPSDGEFAALYAEGVRVLAPSLPVLVALDSHQRIVASRYARRARQAGFDLIAWTSERSGPLVPMVDPYYYSTVLPAIRSDGDILTVLEVLAQDVAVRGVFSDWPATTTFYANCRPPPALTPAVADD
ncbi:MAG: glycerophosphodiester phosphodiesterase family protein [Pseudomonadota bacterium]